MGNIEKHNPNPNEQIKQPWGITLKTRLADIELRTTIIKCWPHTKRDKIDLLVPPPKCKCTVLVSLFLNSLKYREIPPDKIKGLPFDSFQLTSFENAKY